MTLRLQEVHKVYEYQNYSHNKTIPKKLWNLIKPDRTTMEPSQNLNNPCRAITEPLWNITNYFNKDQ